MIKNIMMFKTTYTTLIICLLLNATTFAAESQSSFTELPLSSISSSGERISSDSTLLSVSEFGSNFHHLTESTNTLARSGYVEQVVSYLGSEIPPQEGTLTVEGKVLDWSSVSVVVRTYKVRDQEETLLSECSASVTGNEPGVYEKTFQADCLKVEETQAGEDIKIEAEATDYFGRKSSTSISVNVDLTSPSRPTLEPWPPEYTDISPYTLSGNKQAFSSIYINGKEAVPWDEVTTWSYPYTLAEGNNVIVIVAKDRAENSSGAIIPEILLDQLPPEINITEPIDGYYTNQNSIEVKGTISNDVKTVYVSGIQASIDKQSWTFTALDIPLIEGENEISATAISVMNHTTSTLIEVILDTTSPAKPLVNPVTSPTGQHTQIISGTKDADIAGTAIWLNGQEIYPLDDLTSWSYTATLTHGLNTFQFYSKDKAGNESELSDPVSILYDSTPPELVSISDEGDSTQDFTQLKVSYEFSESETEISEYFVAVGTSPGAEDIRPFESVGLQTSVTITGLNLQHAIQYYITVRAKNSVGLESTGDSTDGIWANGALPEIISYSPKDLDDEGWEGPFWGGSQIEIMVEAEDADGDDLEYSFIVVDDFDDVTIEYFQDFSSLNFTYWQTEETESGIKWIIATVRDPYGGLVEFGGDNIWEIMVIPSAKAPGAR